jgi:hypothetical protein
MGKVRISEIVQIEEFSSTGLSLTDSIMCVWKCGPDEAAELAKDHAVIAAHARGQADGARNILASMTRLAGTGHAGAAKLVLSAQQRAGALQDEAVAKDRWAVPADINLGPSVRKGFEEQRRLIQEMFAERAAREAENDC